MSKIDELIQEYCPDGVSYESLGGLCKIETGKLNANAAVENGQYLFFTTAKEISRIDKYRWDTEALLIAGNANVGDVKHYEGKFDAYQRTYVLNTFDQSISVRFLYFFISSALKNYLENRTNSAAMTYIVLSTLQDFKVPVPPLEVQKEIVNILDKFTQLEAELSAELEARRKQYDFYRNQLLTFGDEEGVRQTTLGEVGVFIRGNGLQKKDFTESGVGCIHYGQVFTHYGTYAEKTKTFVSSETAKKARKAKTGNLVIATTSENDEDVCKAVAWLGDDEIAVSSDAMIYDHNENPKYISYLFQTQDFFKQKKKYISGTKVRRVSSQNLAKINVVLPSRKEQDRIVIILDKFYSLVNSISEGLPAELSARRKQYEYYRTKLLTFQELPS